MARQTPGNYVPLDVNYARDIAIRKAGTNAELLFIRSLAYAKGARTSGFVSDFDLEVVAVGMRAVKAAAEKLCEVGLWVRVNEGWQVRSWDRWNASDRIVSAGGKLGNHKRWHVNEGKTDPSCDLCTDQPPIAPRSHPDSPPMSPPDSQGKGREGKGTTTSSSEAAPRPDVEELCQHLHRRITERGSKATITQGWRDSARLLLDRDGRNVDEAHALIDWCQNDDFWHRNILAMPTFRKQYDQLRLKAQTGSGAKLFAVADRPFTASELENLLGPDVWAPPAAPAGMDPDEAWEWQTQLRREHIAERQAAARARMGRTG